MRVTGRASRNAGRRPGLTAGSAPDILSPTMSAPSLARKHWASAVLLILIFAVSFAAFDRFLLLGLRAWAPRYYASLDTGAAVRNKTTIFGQGDGDVLIFGSSRARLAFGQYMLSSRLNKRIIKDAASGRFPRFFYHFYLKHREEHPRPKAVFYGIDYFIFEKKSFSLEMAALDKTLKLDVLNPAVSFNEASPLLSRISWLFRKKQDIDDFVGDLIKLDRAEEADDGPAEDDADRRGQKNRAVKGRKNKEAKPYPSRPRPYRTHPGAEGSYLQKMLTALEEDGVPVFLIIIPDSAVTNEINFEQDKYKSDVGKLAGLRKNVTVLDFNRPDRFDLKNPELFQKTEIPKSNCHLSTEGSIRFTRKLVETVFPILARETAPDGTLPRSKP